MAKLIEIRWQLGDDGSGHVTRFVRDGREVAERMYVFESLNRDDQIPPRLASIIRQDGRSQATVSYESPTSSGPNAHHPQGPWHTY